MAKGNANGSSRGGGSRGSTRRTNGPMIPKAGFTKNRSKYGDGGKVSK
jgi:hypothetical protein